MNIMTRLFFASALLLVLTPAYSGSALQVLDCEQDDAATRQDILNVAAAWLKAARSQKGGENLEAYVHFPRVATMGEMDFRFILKVPSFEEWGVFMDGYVGSPASKVDAEFDNVADCPDSSLWDSETVQEAPTEKNPAKK